MFYVSEIHETGPKKFENDLQKKTYEALESLDIPFERVDTDEAVTMDDCVMINKKLNMKMVKTLFLCNRQKTSFYVYVLAGDRQFDCKGFSCALDVPRMSFAPEEKMREILGTRIGAATVFSALLSSASNVEFVIDSSVASQRYYGCSDGTTKGYLKIETEKILHVFLPYSGHTAKIIQQGGENGII